MTTFYHVQVGALETQDFRKTPIRSGVFAFGHYQGADAPNVFCRFAAGSDGFCAEGGEAVVN